MPPTKLTPAVEDYLKIIYELTSQHGRANTNQIAVAMDVRPGSVTGMLQKMAAFTPPLVKYEKYRGVMLTPEGKRAALKVTRHHRLLERFLHETLGFPWDEVHAEAHRLEHVISKKFEERMDAVLGYPQFDPHGAPIPSRDLELPSSASIRMQDLHVGQRAVVQRVPDDTPALLRYLAEQGLALHASFEVLECSPLDGSLKIQVEKKPGPIELPPTITGEIFVTIKD